MTKVPKLRIKQTKNIPNFKFPNLESLDLLTSPAIEEGSWHSSECFEARVCLRNLVV